MFTEPSIYISNQKVSLKSVAFYLQMEKNYQVVHLYSISYINVISPLFDSYASLPFQKWNTGEQKYNLFMVQILEQKLFPISISFPLSDSEVSKVLRQVMSVKALCVFFPSTIMENLEVKGGFKNNPKNNYTRGEILWGSYPIVKRRRGDNAVQSIGKI